MPLSLRFVVPLALALAAIAYAVAVAERVHALVLNDALEVAQHLFPGVVVVGDQLGERLLRRLRDQRAARLQVTDEPLEREAVHQRHDGVGDGGEGKRERNDETQRERHGAPSDPLLPSKVCAN